MYKILTEQGLEQVNVEYKEALDTEDYEKALRFNQLMYESEFSKLMICEKLVKNDSGFSSELVNRIINSKIKLLGELFEMAMMIKYIQLKEGEIGRK